MCVSYTEQFRNRTQMYLKVTTGTGGMGLNIPYTHSEDKPSRNACQNETAFGHTGLPFLLARTPNSPIVKEVKPAAMIDIVPLQSNRLQTSMATQTCSNPSSITVIWCLNASRKRTV